MYVLEGGGGGICTYLRGRGYMYVLEGGGGGGICTYLRGEGRGYMYILEGGGEGAYVRT